MTKRTDFFKDSSFFSKERPINPFWRNAAIFAIGLLVGWLVFGWLLFPVKYTQVYPNELHPDALNDYLLMAAESYATTHDLRTAGKRLRYWDDPNILGPMLNDLAQSIETTNPAGAAYLHVLARDLHLPATPTASVSSRPAPGPSRSFSLLWLLIPLLALAVLAGLIFLAQRFGLLSPRAVPAETLDGLPPTDAAPEDAAFSEPAPRRPTDFDSLEAPDATVAMDEHELEDDSDWMPAAIEETETFAQPEIIEADEAPPVLDDVHPDLPPDETDDLPEQEPAPDISEADESEAEISVETPETISAPPPPPPILDEVESAALDELDKEEEQQAPQVLRFDGDPAYNAIIAIEPNDDYLGEYGLSVGKTAPNNPNLALTLEVWLFDKSDTQTTEIALTPAVITADPDLKARYIPENTPVLPLREGQAISLETAELRLGGRVRRVKFGAATSDGVPVIESAEIELLGRRK